MILPVYRIKYIKSSKNIVELEASSVTEAWKKIRDNQISEAIWNQEGQISYKPEVTEEITTRMASNPKG